MFGTNKYQKSYRKRLVNWLINLKQSVNRVKSDKIRKAKTSQITIIKKFLNK